MVIWTRQSNSCCSYSFYEKEITFDKIEFCICWLLVSRKLIYLKSQPAECRSHAQYLRCTLNEFMLLFLLPAGQHTQHRLKSAHYIKSHSTNLHICRWSSFLWQQWHSSHRTLHVSSPFLSQKVFQGHLWPRDSLSWPIAGNIKAAGLLTAFIRAVIRKNGARARWSGDTAREAWAFSCCGNSCQLNCYKQIFW